MSPSHLLVMCSPSLALSDLVSSKPPLLLHASLSGFIANRDNKSIRTAYRQKSLKVHPDRVSGFVCPVVQQQTLFESETVLIFCFNHTQNPDNPEAGTPTVPVYPTITTIADSALHSTLQQISFMSFPSPMTFSQTRSSETLMTGSSKPDKHAPSDSKPSTRSVKG